MGLFLLCRGRIRAEHAAGSDSVHLLDLASPRPDLPRPRREAQRLMTTAFSAVEATGLPTDASVSAYAQKFCTLVYSTARGGRQTSQVGALSEGRIA